jgi:K+/H+ antiporter YhaU regulatory subunit KhtT
MVYTFLPSEKSNSSAGETRPGDMMLIYGSTKEVPELESRPAGPEGDVLHIERSRVQHRIMEAQEREDVRDAGAEDSARLQAFHSLLHLSEGYSVTELTVEAGNWMAGRTLADLRLTDEAMQVFGIRRADGEYIATPSGGTYIRKGDVLLMYGKTEFIGELEARRAGETGDAAHARRVGELRGNAGESRSESRTEARPEAADAVS